MRKADLSSLLIDLTIDTKRSLLLFLTRDGTINRQGTGELDRFDTRLFAGVVGPDMFSRLVAQFPEEWLMHPGAFSLPGTGLKCKLGIEFSDKRSKVEFSFEYFSEGEGPPRDICEFVMKALDLTDSWYEAQKGSTHG